MKHTAQAYVKIRNTFRNLLANLFDFDPAKNAVPFDQMEHIDRWALGKCTKLVEKVTESYERYAFHEVYREVYDFVVVTLSSFYFDVLKDRLYTAGKNSRARL